VIEAVLLSLQPVGERLAVLPEIMKKPSQIGLVADAKNRRVLASQACDITEVLGERLPAVTGWA
jgi:hypothetical protein